MVVSSVPALRPRGPRETRLDEVGRNTALGVRSRPTSHLELRALVYIFIKNAEMQLNKKTQKTTKTALIEMVNQLKPIISPKLKNDIPRLYIIARKNCAIVFVLRILLKNVSKTMAGIS